METSTQTLNPFAVSYVPLAKRDVDDVDKERKTMLSREADVSDAYAAVDEIPEEMDSCVMEEEMDLAYLQMIFPGVSDQSLVDVYNVNMGDLESALDMLSDLESAFDQSDVETVSSSSSGECSSSVTGAGETSMASASSEVTVATS
ncbi:hypothetical protein RND81_03G126700 [Saponaria officinalis]|uniref:CUE domain-containing protein n=1 Tax=Saponaria officinalis TaxID=3572 RepID=A0AAW1M377_SAPOF